MVFELMTASKESAVLLSPSKLCGYMGASTFHELWFRQSKENGGEQGWSWEQQWTGK